MDFLGVRQMKNSRKQAGCRKNSGKKDIKVVYISSPMKVKTCASNFRALVQELTGKDSDTAAHFMDVNGGAGAGAVNSDATRNLLHGRAAVDNGHDDMANNNNNSNNSNQESPTCSDSGFDAFEGAIWPQMEGGFWGMFASNLLQESPSHHQLDVLTSFGSV